MKRLEFLAWAAIFFMILCYVQCQDIRATVAEVRRLRRGYTVLKNQLRILMNTLQDDQKDRADIKESFKKSKLARTEVESVRSLFNVTIVELETIKLDVASTKTLLNVTGEELVLTKSELAPVKESLNVTGEDLESTKSELALVKKSLNVTGEEVMLTKTELASVKKSFSVTEKELVSTKSELASVKMLLNATWEELISTKTELASIKMSLNVTGVKLELIQMELASEKKLLKGTNSKLKSTSEDLQTQSRRLQKAVPRLDSLEEKALNLHNMLLSIKKGKAGSVGFEVLQHAQPYTLAHSELLKFDTVTLNQGNAYNSRTGLFTAPVTGIYLFWANIMSANTGYFHILLCKAGRVIAAGYTGRELVHGKIPITYLTHVKKGEKVWFVNDERNGRTVIFGHGHSHYGGALLTAN